MGSFLYCCGAAGVENGINRYMSEGHLKVCMKIFFKNAFSIIPQDYQNIQHVDREISIRVYMQQYLH